jgi:hypothetical protein
MHETNKSKATRLAIQAVGACFGVLGLSWICMGIGFAIMGIRESDLPAVFFAAGSDRIRIGLVGCGSRGMGGVRNCVDFSPNVEIVALGGDDLNE